MSRMKIDKERATAHIRDDELKLVMIKNLSKAESVLRSHGVRTTDFLNPYERRNFAAILRGIDGLSFHICCYEESAERMQMQIYPEYADVSELQPPYAILKIRTRSGGSLSHRDCLGSLLGLGIKREKTGDIYLQGDGAYLAVDRDIADFILMNLTLVGREKVDLEEIREGELEKGEEEYTERIVYLPSLRADALLAEAYHLSRGKAQALIEGGRFRADYEPITSNSREIRPPALLSLKGYGRAYFDEVLTETKKGRLRAKIRQVK